jgi:hypothetical protein
MARSFLTPINMNQNAINNPVAQVLATAPSSPLQGQFYYDSASANFLLVYNGSAWVNPLARANHTGTQLSATISDLATTVQAYHLNQFAVPTANIPMGGFQITGLATAQTATGQAASWDFVTGRSLATIAAAAASAGAITASSQNITNLATPTATGHAAEYTWVLGRPLNAFAVPTANVPMGGFTLTGLAAPTATGQAATWDYVNSSVQSAAAGISSKDPVLAVSVANIATLSGLATTVDGVALNTLGQRVLLTGQTTASQNGPYVVASGAWTRPVDEGGTQGELDNGAMWLVQSGGTTYGGTQWRLATNAVVVGTTGVSIVQFSAAAAYTAGNGILFTGSVISAVPAASGAVPTAIVTPTAAAGGLTVGAAGLAVDGSVVRKYFTSIGDGSTTAIVVTHGLGTQNVTMQCHRATTPYDVVECDMAATSTTTATFTFTTAPTSAQYQVVIHG